MEIKSSLCYATRFIRPSSKLPTTPGGGEERHRKRNEKLRQEGKHSYEVLHNLQNQSISATICAAQPRNSKSEQTFPLVLDPYAVLFTKDGDSFVGLGAETTVW